MSACFFGEIASFASPELVVERFLVMPLRKRDCLILPAVLTLAMPLVGAVLTRKKLRILSGKWLEVFGLVDSVFGPDKLRFSVGSACCVEGDDGLKSCVMSKEKRPQGIDVE